MQRITYHKTAVCEVSNLKKVQEETKPADVFGIVSCFWAWLLWIPAQDREVKKEILLFFCLFCFLSLWSNQPQSHVMILTDVVPLYSKPPPTLLPGCALNFLLHSSSKAKSSYATPHPHTHTHTPPATPPLSNTMWSEVKDQRSFPGPNPHSLPQTGSHGLNQCCH